jgi:organic hydroperoxide reductase OsmC/OhrA
MRAYQAETRWMRREGERFVDGRYWRGHAWRFDGGAIVPVSANPDHVPPGTSDVAAVDPEEALVAAASSCHMLFFLAFAAKAGFVVDAYADDAVGYLNRDADGCQFMARIELRPDIAFSGERLPTPVEIEALHHKAHEACYVANSLRTEISVSPPSM